MSDWYEFRVVGVEAAFNRPYVNEHPSSLGSARRMAEYFRENGDHNVRVERRRVGSWEETES